MEEMTRRYTWYKEGAYAPLTPCKTVEGQFKKKTYYKLRPNSNQKHNQIQHSNHLKIHVQFTCNEDNSNLEQECFSTQETPSGTK